jgi:hypothetical protein
MMIQRNHFENKVNALEALRISMYGGYFRQGLRIIGETPA